mgnify:FL=1
MATLKEVAEFANVSIATVSRILNDDNSLTVLPETKEKVIKAAEQLNYIPKSKRLPLKPILARYLLFFSL